MATWEIGCPKDCDCLGFGHNNLEITNKGEDMPNTWVVVSEIRNCDMCHQDPPVPAYADGKMRSGPWANMCQPCFEIYGIGLGLGMGQELLLEPPSTTTMAVHAQAKEPAKNHAHQWDNYLHTAYVLVRKPLDHNCKLCSECGNLLCEVQGE